METDNHEPQSVELLTLEPIPPDTVASMRAELMPTIEMALRQNNKESLLENNEISLEMEHTFPTDQIVVVVAVMITTMAVKVFEEIILPELKKKYRVLRKHRGKSTSRGK